MGLSLFLAIIGLILAITGIVLLVIRKQRIVARVCLIAGIFLILVPYLFIYVLLN
jgi:hypothetical protein